MTTKAAALSARAAFEAIRANSIQLFSVKQAAHSTFRPELAEVGRIVGKKLRDSGITKEEASGLQAIYQAAVATMSRRTGMSPKQIWTQFGPRILGEPDITRNEAGEISIPGGIMERIEESFHQARGDQAKARMQGLDPLAAFGPLHPELSNNPKEALARLRADRTGAVPDLFHFPEVGKIGIAWGKAGNPYKDYAGGYGLAHIDAKHPGAADMLQDFFKRARITKWLPDKVILEDPNSLTVVGLNWHGTKSQWIVTAYEIDPNYRASSGSKDQIATPSIAATYGTAGAAAPITGQVKHSSDVLPDWKKDLSKLKGKFSQGSKGDFFPEQLIVRWKNADRSTLLHESGHAFLSMEMGVAAELAKLSER